MNRTQVGIVGGGPAGLMLALLLERAGIDSVILESRSRHYVESRVRAGLLEQNTVDLMRDLGVGERLAREGLIHNGIYLRRRGETLHIPITELTGRGVTIYGQQEVVKDLTGAFLERGGELHFEVTDLRVHALDSSQPSITYRVEGRTEELACDYIAGCDGFHGVCRPSIPEGVLTEHEFTYPFAWLGVLANASPATDELIYAWHERGFALYSMRSPEISRLYIQVGADELIDNWPDERIWSELQTRLAADGWKVNEGRIFDKGITAMRSFVCEPMQWGNLFLLGDAAHIVPPTGAKGLNLAVNDARLLAAALITAYATGSRDALDGYSAAALRRVWRAQAFANELTEMLHDPGERAFGRGLQMARLDYLFRSSAAANSLAENYAGLPAEADF
jgi:p-hydroxybenzoate 3-monooxygenase